MTSTDPFDSVIQRRAGVSATVRYGAPFAYVNGASFWQPAFLTGSAWLGHAPFAFWLTSVLEPRRFVELGTYGGYSHFVFCQAVQHLLLETHCYAVDTWQGDEHGGFYAEDVFESVTRHNEAHYAAFSELIRSTFDDAVARFADRSIDLLHIDGCHSYDAVAHDFETWRSKLSDRAVVLFHDTHVLDRGFGVHRLWNELTQQFPTFEFLHDHGLGVLGYGRMLPPELGALFEATDDVEAARAVRAAYARLGAAIRAESELPRLTRQLQVARDRNQKLSGRLAAGEKKLQALQQRVDASRSTPKEAAGSGNA